MGMYSLYSAVSHWQQQDSTKNKDQQLQLMMPTLRMAKVGYKN